MDNLTTRPHINAMGAIRAYRSANDGGSNVGQYGLPDNATELQDLIEHRNMNFAIGNIFKACYRLGHCDHSDKLRDLNKIKWFIEREIRRVENSDG